MSAAVLQILVLLIMGITADGCAQSSQASEAGTIVEVKLSADGRRAIVQADGEFGRYRTYELVSPNRLVVDLESVQASRGLRIERPKGKAVREIRVGKTDSGTRVVLDFGSHPLPGHRIVRLKDALLVLLGDSPSGDEAVWTAQPAQSSGLAKRFADSTPDLHATSAEDPSGLSVKECRVVNGLIVLEVSDRNTPRARYRIKLGLDLDNLGFHRAHMERIGDATAHSTAKRKPNPPPQAPSRAKKPLSER
ncbi:MAG: AMIN domain-containing protein [Thermodesulfobacteriota bacterium]